MHDDRRLTEVRLDRFLRERIIPAVYPRSVPLTLSSWDAPGEPVPVLEALRQQFGPQEQGAPWGRPWSTKWLRLQGEVPDSWGSRADTAIEVLVDLGFSSDLPGFQCEGTAWRADGTVIKAISPRNQYIPLKLLGSGMSVDFYVEAAANPDLSQGWTFAATPYGDKATAGSEPQYRLGPIVIAELNQTVWELHQDIWTLSGLMHELPMELPRRHEILRALERMLDVMDPDDVPGTAAAGRAALADVLARPAYASAHQLVATGHAHIDSAWLWPVRETIRKCARTFSNVVALMDEDPGFVFSCSSAQQLAWIKEYYPELFGRIREKARTGQFVPVGGMWVESDSNMPGGEAMARQFLEGKRFFLDEFGVDCQEAWLPDTFGYSAALPQIVKAAGSRWFLTQKISWNQMNRMPHHTFKWEGIDGTRLFTHFPPVDTYNAEVSGRGARARRAELPGPRAAAPCPCSRSATATAAAAPPARCWPRHGAPPTWKVRPGCGSARPRTSSPAPRRSTRTSPSGSARCTSSCTAAPTPARPTPSGATGAASTCCGRPSCGARRRRCVPAPAIRRQSSKRLWRLVLLQQFHDILPGSSIAWVHQDAERNYDAVARDLEAIIAGAAAALLGEGEQEFLLNAAPHARHGVPALAAASPVRTAAPVQATAAGGGYVLDNGIIRAEVNTDGLLVSLQDHNSGREAIAPGQFGNLLELHRDTPNEWDAWDIDAFYRRNVTPLLEARSVTLERDGDAAAVVVQRLAGGSAVTQRILLEPGAPSLAISTAVDWQEREKLLKLGFAFDLRADRSASETQFGHVFRPTHLNTSWEAAKFEICAHRWIHVAEPGYGVAVSNAASYGHDVTRTVREDDGGTTTTVRVSLLRAPKFPDPDADRGMHELTVTVRPGAGIADAVEEGYRTNLAPRVVTGAHGAEPLFAVSNPAIVIEAVKLAEDGSGDVIVRLYESLGERSSGTVSANFDCSGVRAVDLLERPADAPGVSAGPGGTAKLSLRPFQLVTLRFRR